MVIIVCNLFLQILACHELNSLSLDLDYVNSLKSFAETSSQNEQQRQVGWVVFIGSMLVELFIVYLNLK